MTDRQDGLREQARQRIKSRRSFWQLVITLVLVAILLNVIWFVTSGYAGYYWPIWPMIAFVAAIVVSAITTFGPLGGPITDAHIDREIRKIQGPGGPTGG